MALETWGSKGNVGGHNRHVMMGDMSVALETQEGNGSVKGWGCEETRKVMGLGTWGVKGTLGTCCGGLREHRECGGIRGKSMGVERDT